MEKSGARWRSGVLFLIVFVFSLLPRLTGLARYVTPDELIWVFRTVQFREAILAGAWADTLVSGHPGIVTTWLGVLGVNLQLWLQPSSREAYTWITHLAFFMPDNMAAFERLAVFLPWARLAVAVVNSLGITAVYALVRHLWNHNMAWLVALLLAFDPFVAGLSGILHVDALMTTFATLALLMLLSLVDGRLDRKRWQITAVAGIVAALAILSKTPALLLLPMAGLLFVVAWWLGNGRIRELVMTGLVWGTAVLITIWTAYPALWAVPGDVWRLLSGNANRHIEEALRPSFFMGHVAYDHGALFYPVVLLFRLSPVVFAGLVVGALLLLWPRRSSLWSRRKAIFLLLWAVLYIVGISFAAKKFDRYVLAVIPALIILAALGWQQLAHLKPAFRRYLVPVLIGVQALYLLYFLPYPLAAYNPLAGGPWMAEAVMPLGWGEAVSASGRWLAELPDSEEKTAVAGLAPSFAPFFPGQTLLASPENIAQADYVILTAGGRQIAPERWPDLPSEFRLRHTIRYGGLEQAWIYEQAAPQKSDLVLDALPEPVFFGGEIGLNAAQVAVRDDKLDVWLRWQVQAGKGNGRYTIKLQLEDEAGRDWADREIELTNETYFYPEHWPPGARPQVRYTFDLPPGLPPAAYAVVVSLFDASGAQLPALAADNQFMGVTWALPGFDISVPPSSAIDVPRPVMAEWLAGALILRGRDALPEKIVTGDTAVLDLYWQSTASLPDNLLLTLYLGDMKLHDYPISRFDSGRWQPEQQIHEKYNLVVPPEMGGGVYPLRLAVGEETAVTLGDIEIIATDRLFSLPDAVERPLAYRFADTIHLRGLDWPATVVSPGEDVALTLYWQTETQPSTLISAFVHLVGPEGDNVAQADRWPGGLPSDTWAAGEVIVDTYTITLPPDAPLGEYKMAVGLYTAVDGVRLPVVTAAGTAVLDNRVMLPITLTVEDADE